MSLYRTLRSLRDQERGIRPDAAWMRQTRQTLLMQVKNTMPTAEVAARHREPFFVSLYEGMINRLRGPVLATMSIAGVILGGSIASVSAAETALPGDTLYSVKLVTEQARLVLTGSKPNRVRLKSEFTKRRVEELKAIITADDPEKDARAGLAADGLKRDLDTLKQQLTDVQTDGDSEGVAEALKTVDKNTVEVAKGLVETQEGLSPEVKEKLVAAQVQATDVGIKALEVLVSVNENPGEGILGVVSSEEIGASLTAHAEVAAQSLAATKALSGSIESSPALGAKEAGVTTSTQKLVEDAEASLATVQQLAGEQKLGEAVSLLKDVTMKSFTAQKQVAQQVLTIGTASSSAAILLNIGSTSSTPSGVSPSSTTSAVQGVATSTQ